MENTEGMVILIDEVSRMAQLSKSRINGLLSEKKFVRPISASGGKRRWLRSDVIHWLESQSTITSPSPTSAKQKRRNANARNIGVSCTRRGGVINGFDYLYKKFWRGT